MAILGTYVGSFGAPIARCDDPTGGTEQTQIFPTNTFCGVFYNYNDLQFNCNSQIDVRFDAFYESGTISTCAPWLSSEPSGFKCLMKIWIGPDVVGDGLRIESGPSSTSRFSIDGINEYTDTEFGTTMLNLPKNTFVYVVSIRTSSGFRSTNIRIGNIPL